MTDLDRVGNVRIQEKIAENDPLWSSAELNLASAVEVDLDVRATATGQVVALGRIRARISGPCRRCLEPVQIEFDQEVSLVWAPPDELGPDGEKAAEEDEVRTLDVSTNELKLAEAIREELILAAPNYLVCDETCRGLCPRCGINRNEESCDCTLEEPDPRWDVLRALQDE